MKKSILFIVFLFIQTIFAWSISPSNLISKSVESKNLGSPEDTVPQFKLGNVNFITDNSGSAEYKNGWIRNTIQWCLYRTYNDGPLLIKADEGYWIKDVTFTYVEQADGMLADKPGASQSSIAAYASGKAIAINATERQFYVGKKTSGNGGYLTITKFAVTYCKRPTAVSLEDMTLSVGDEFQLTPDVQPADADTIYSWSSDNSDVVSVDKNGVIAAKSVGEANISVSAGSLLATCKLKVEADSSVSIVETFSSCSVEKNFEGTTDIVGDSGIYNWQATYYQRQLSGTDDKIDGKQGIRVRYDGSLEMDGVQEGGVKAIAFDWRTTNSSLIVNHSVNVGNEHYEYNSDAVKSATVFHFARRFEVKENTQFSFDMASKIGTQGQCYVIVSPVTITPYLLFNVPNHRASISVDTLGMYDLNKVLINNTGEAPVFEVTGNTTGATTEIVDGVLVITKKTQRGVISIKASWNSGKVYTTMELTVENLPELQFEQDTIVVNLADKPFVNPLTKPSGTGAVSYTSSNMSVATVNSDGTVTPTGAGETVITAHVAAGTEYGAAEASYVVVVSYVPTGGEGWTETFSQCTTTKLYDGRVYVDGDNGVYDWSVARFQRLEEDTISGAQGIRIRYQGAIASAGEQEGGVKDVRFDWHATGVDNPVHFFVNVGEKEYEYKSDHIPTTTVMHFDRGFGLKENVALSISVPAQEKTAQSYIVVGPVTIVPYLLFTASNHKDTIRLVDATSYDLRDVLINNTDSVGEIMYSILSDGTEAATIEGSVVDVSQAKKNGAVAVEAAWGDVTTTMTLWVEAEDPAGLEEVQNAECRMQNGKVIVDGQLRIWRGGEWYDVIGNTIK